MAPEVVILILAAGASSRMGGRDKLLEDADGEPLLRRVARRATAAGAPVVVVLPPDRPARAAALDGLAVSRVVAARAGEGMAASLAAGIAAAQARGAAGAMVVPADMPDLSDQDFLSVINAFLDDPHLICRGAAADGTPGHPALFPADLFAELLALTGDAGGRAVLARHRGRVRIVPLPGLHALTDLDTPADWSDWRARGGG